MIFLLESPVLDKYVNDERNEFEINKTNPDLETQLTWNDINQKLEDTLNEIINSKFPGIKEKRALFSKELLKNILI